MIITKIQCFTCVQFCYSLLFVLFILFCSPQLIWVFSFLCHSTYKWLLLLNSFRTSLETFEHFIKHWTRTIETYFSKTSKTIAQQKWRQIEVMNNRLKQPNNTITWRFCNSLSTNNKIPFSLNKYEEKLQTRNEKEKYNKCWIAHELKWRWLIVKLGCGQQEGSIVYHKQWSKWFCNWWTIEYSSS